MMKTDSRQQRDSNLELLRILGMFAIIAYHFFLQTAIYHEPNSSFSHCIAMFLGSFGRSSVNIFILIGAWFLIDLPFKSIRLVRLYIPYFCYTVVFTGIVILSGKVQNGTASGAMLRALTPFSSSPLWFITDYIFLLLLTPALNTLIHALDLRKYRFLHWVLIIVFVVIPTVESALPGFGVYKYYVIKSDMSWMVALYLLAGYWKKNPDLWIKQKKWNAGCFVGMIVLCAGLCLTDFLLGKYCTQGFVTRKYHAFLEFLVMDLSSVFCFCFAVAAFFFFQHVRIASRTLSNVINRISKNILGIYILHQIPVFIPVMWGVFHTEKWVDSPWFVLFESGTVLLVFIAAWITDNFGTTALKPLLNASWLINSSKRIDDAINN